MAAFEELILPLDANQLQINNLGTPGSATDATQVTSTVNDIQDIGQVGVPSLGISFQAAPAQHTHRLKEGIDIVEFRNNFRTLLAAFVNLTNQIPPGLENEYIASGGR